MLGGLCGWLAWRLAAAARLVRQVREAAERRGPVLLDGRRGASRSMGLDRLALAVNSLAEENARMRGAGRGYHGQIQALLGNLREAVVTVGEGNILISSNPAFRSLVGAEADPAGKRLDAYFHGPSLVEYLGAVRAGGEMHHRELEIEVRHKTRWMEVSGTVLPEGGAEGTPHTLLVFHDITQQKHLEKMRTDFVANVTHELRTPVTVIKGFAETLVEDEAVLSAEEKTRFLEKIRNNAERLDLLLRDLLLLSRLESTAMVLHCEPVSLQGLLQEVVETWLAQIEQDGRRLVLDCAPDGDLVQADPLRLTQVLNNLLENVLRHARGFRTVHFSTRREGEAIRLILADDGCGIPEKDLPHIFQRFYRVDKGRSRESGGTGLGLSIVKHIVKQHGGEIHAISRKGEGTRIEFTLPAAAADAGTEPANP